MSTLVVADKTPIVVANGRTAVISDGNKESEAPDKTDPTEDALKKTAASRSRLTQQDVAMPDHNNNNNDKNNTNLVAPLTRLETHESSTTSFTTSSPSTTNKVLNSHTQHSSDKMAATTDSFGTRQDTSTPRSNSTAARFKEKRRPEPLKLNPNINQEIPLDLSVKSAGNIPSGIRGCIFNLPNAAQMATLETPRIQWQDNETFLSLSKSRLFSSSTNPGQRVRMSIGGSPPITPSTPSMDLITSPLRAASLRPTNQSASVSSSHEAQNSTSRMICSPLELNKFQILDRITRANKTLLRYYQLKSEIRGAPRRSCSTDNLEYLCTKVMQIQANQNHLNLRKETNSSDQRQDQDSVTNHSSNLNQPHINDHLANKKNAISPLATKSLSSTTANFETGRFSYGNQHTLMFVQNDEQKSPRTNKVVTPTSVANATVNLSNIHLSSPTRDQDSSPPSGLSCDLTDLNLEQQVSIHHNSSFSSLSEILAANQRSETELSSLDPLLSAACCQQTRRTNSGSTQGPDEPQNHNLRHDSLMSNTYLQQHQTTPSFSSLATLNTPTIISPSQLRSGNICFLPSPTLSPMSSVFDLPSPLLVFPHTAQQIQPSLNSSTNKTLGAISPNATSKNKSPCPLNNQRNTSIELGKPTNDTTTRVDAESISNIQQSKNNSSPAYSETDLSHLITPARRKVGTAQPGGNDNLNKIENNNRVGGLDIDDVNMEATDNDVDLNVENSTPDIPERANVDETRPATSIPEIYVTGSKLQEPTGSLNRQKCSSAQNENNWHQLEKSNPASINQRQFKNPDAANSSSQVSYASQLINTSSNHRHQRDVVDKRALSPNSFRSRVNIYHNERHGSSSAPPDVNQLRARSKVKTIEAWSYNELACLKNKEQVGQPHCKTYAPLTDHNHRLLQQNQLNAGASSQHPDGSNFQYRLSCHEAQNEFEPSWTQTTTAIQPSGGPIKQTSSHTSSSVVKPMIEGRSSSAEPPGSFQSKQPRNSNYNVAQGTTINQFPRDHRNLSHSAQQLQRDYSISQTRPWCAMASGSDHLQHPGQSTHLVGSNQQSMHQQQHSASENHLNDISDTNLNINCSRAQQQQQQQQQKQFVDEIPLYKTVGEGTFLSSKGAGYMQNCQPRLQSSYTRASINHLDNLVIQSQQTGLISNVSARTNLTGNKTQNVPFSYIADTALTNCIPQPMETNIFCSNNWSNNGNNATFITNVVNFNNNNHGRSLNHLNSLKSAEHNSALASVSSNRCNIEAENHSDPSEGNSMDFCPLTGPGSTASRSSSAASSNMAARKYHCDQCSKSFTRSDMLTRHRRLHSGDRPFQCSECKQEFSRSDHLSTHMRTHTGEKPYRCKLCSYSACRKDMITRHMKVHNRSQTSIDTMDSM